MDKGVDLEMGQGQDPEDAQDQGQDRARGPEAKVETVMMN